METVTATVEVSFPDGNRGIEMLLKDMDDIEDCEEGKIVVVYLKSGTQLTGYFNGTDGYDFLLRPISGGVFSAACNIYKIEKYFEEIK